MTGARTGRWSPLEPLEVAAGIVLDQPVAPPRRTATRTTARQALEGVVLGHLVQGRASVSFSGGRDSSLVLAVVCHVARREGLPDPVAITFRHPSAESQESDWQEMVIAHLDLQDWVTIDVADSLDIGGPVARASLLTTGVQTPPNAYLHLPAFQAAPPGTLFTGAGGDEVLGSRGDRLIRVLARRTRPRPRDAAAAAYALAPPVARRYRESRRPYPWAPWLTPDADAAVRGRLAAVSAARRLRWDTEVRTWARSRTTELGLQVLDRLATAEGVGVASPLSDPAFVDAFADEVGPAGPRSRSYAMAHLAEDLLPPAVLRRTTKAAFGGLIWGPGFQEFARTWEPGTLAPEIATLVDVDRLAAEFREASPLYTAMMLAEAAWLGSVGRSHQGHDRAQGVVEP